MAQLVAPVVEGVLQQNNTAITTTDVKKLGSSELGKDAFLQLLVCQMQNQDPLNPSTDTQFVSQLATFSQLEQLQNLNSGFQQNQAFTLVGKNVLLTDEDTNGKEGTISGVVDFITIVKGKAKLSVDGKLYDMDKLQSVIDSEYVLNHSLPKIEDTIKLEYDASKPKNLTFEVNLGLDGYAATQVALLLNDQVLDSSMISIDGNKVTIKKEAFAELPNGVIEPTVAFNNSPYYTTVDGKLQITIKNSTVTVNPPADDTEGNEEEDSQQTDGSLV